MRFKEAIRNTYLAGVIIACGLAADACGSSNPNPNKPETPIATVTPTPPTYFAGDLQANDAILCENETSSAHNIRVRVRGIYFHPNRKYANFLNLQDDRNYLLPSNPAYHLSLLVVASDPTPFEKLQEGVSDVVAEGILVYTSPRDPKYKGNLCELDSAVLIGMALPQSTVQSQNSPFYAEKRSMNQRREKPINNIIKRRY